MYFRDQDRPKLMNVWLSKGHAGRLWSVVLYQIRTLENINQHIPHMVVLNTLVK